MARMERQLRPDRSALDKFGFELREWRKARGLSQARLGAKVHVSADLIYRVESGTRKPSRDLAERCDRILRARGALLRHWDEVTREAEQRRHATVPHADTFTDNDVGMHDLRVMHVTERPEVTHLRVMEDTCGSMVLGDVMVFPCQADDGRIVLVSIPRREFLRNGVDATIAGAAAVILGGEGLPSAASVDRAGDHPVERFSRTRQLLRDEDNLLGPERVRPVLYEQMTRAVQAGKGLRGADRLRLLEVQAQFGDLYAWLQQDSGNYRDARYWLDRALDWASMAGDQEASAFILARKSQVAGEMGDAEDAVGIARLAERRPNPNQNWHASIAETYAGYGYALSGEKTACFRSYDRALQLFDLARSEPSAKYGHFLDHAYIDVYRARSAAVLGDNAAAAAAFDSAIGSLPAGYHRDKGVYLTYKAKAQADARDPGPAARSAMRALAIGAETHSARIMTGLESFDRTLPAKWSSIPEIKSFRDALNNGSHVARLR